MSPQGCKPDAESIERNQVNVGSYQFLFPFGIGTMSVERLVVAEVP
jgi:hypothetical protein